LELLANAATFDGEAELLVSVDKALLGLRCSGTVEIIRPGEFWARVMR
jgi:predicted nucleic acid-binding protein